MKVLNRFFYFFVFVLFFIGCQEKTIEIPPFTPPTTERVVLVEELTGVSCQGCPAGSTKLQSLITQYDGNLIGVAVHGTFLCEPIEGRSIYDFRNSDAQALESKFSPFLGKPAAVVNRVKYNDQDFLGIDNVGLWQQYIESEFQKPNVLSLFLNHEYDEASRQIFIDVTTVAIENISGEVRLSAYITESHIIDAQKNGPNIEDDYEHNHVLRDMISEISGDFLSNGMTVGQEIQKAYSYTLPEEDGTWVADNMEVIFAVNIIDNDGEEIVQANYFHLVE